MVKIGGHLFSRSGVTSVDWIKEASEVLKSCHTSGEKWVLVVGGGDAARGFIKAARTLGASETVCDEIAIMVTRIHASLFIQALGDVSYPNVVGSVEELRNALVSRDLAVAGGFWPGQSTFAVAAYCAETIRARKMLVATNVEGIYDKDPRMFRDARLISRMTYSELRRLMEGSPQTAGEYRMVDAVGLSILERSRISLSIIDGRDPKRLREALSKGYAGTIVEPD
ncbi:MAG: UMP kinase [Candidatus Caldarchaeales archaeon]|nr:UMP kinase [Candidatus Caldarchaeales archaeon]